MYTDNTLLTWGEYQFMKLCRVPADYLIRLSERKCTDQNLVKYIKENMDKLKARRDGKIQAPPLELKFKMSGVIVQLVCPDTDKIIFISQKDAKYEIRRIQQLVQEGKKPSRSYECKKCGGWHLTSMPYDEWYAIQRLSVR